MTTPAPRLHEDEVAIDTALARRLLETQLPAYGGRLLRRISSGGTDNAVFRVGDDCALRMPLHPGGVAGLLKEQRWVPRLAPHLSLAVPEILAIGEPDEGYPFPWAVLRWLPGEDALVGRVDSTHELALALGRFVRELQAIDMTDAPAPGADGFVRGLPLAGRDATFRAALARCDGLLDLELMAEIWDDALAAPPWEGPPVWLHADLLPSNLLLRDGHLVGVLDFGAMATGDPAYDVTPAWQVLDGDTRSVFRDTVEVDDATWRRSRGLVVSGAVIALPYYLDTNPSMVATARRGIAEVIDEIGR